jgi:hypothetical protein
MLVVAAAIDLSANLYMAAAGHIYSKSRQLIGFEKRQVVGHSAGFGTIGGDANRSQFTQGTAPDAAHHYRVDLDIAQSPQRLAVSVLMVLVGIRLDINTIIIRVYNDEKGGGSEVVEDRRIESQILHGWKGDFHVGSSK